MVKSKPAIYSDLAKVDATTDEDIARQIAEDPDTAPELTDEWFDKADLHYGETLLRRGRGRPPLGSLRILPPPGGGSGTRSARQTRVSRRLLDHAVRLSRPAISAISPGAG